MKERASFTFDKKTMDILKKLSKLDRFRNKSHVVEEAIKLLDKEVKENEEKE